MRGILAGCLVALGVIFAPAVASASLGVGVGTGRINIDEPIKSGSIYTLPTITVFNTGTTEASYAMAVTLNENQPELKPDPAWFSFSPEQFTLAPGQSQVVTPAFNPPLVVQPGDYFAYLEARPDSTVQQGTAAVGVAAATKLSFSVEPSNILLAVFYRILGLYKQFAPYSYIATALLAVFIMWRMLRKRLHLEIRVKKPVNNKKPGNKKSESKTSKTPSSKVTKAKKTSKPRKKKKK